MGRGIYCANGDAAVTQEEEFKDNAEAPFAKIVQGKLRAQRFAEKSSEKRLALLQRAGLKDQRYI